jgi:hypothetical protein
MADAEGAILARLLLTLGGRRDIRLFRNTVGSGWVGKPVRMVQEDDGLTVVLRHARRVTFGLATGSPDLVGFRKLTITPAHVGQDIAQFLGIEVKAGTTRLTRDQAAFLAMLERFGAYAAVAGDLPDLDGL